MSHPKTKVPRRPSNNTLRAAQRHVFDHLRWQLLLHGSPPQFYVHGDAEFERLRAGDGIETTADLASATVVDAIVRLVERASPRALSFGFGGLSVLEERRDEVSNHLKKRLRQRITRARNEGGYQAVAGLQSLADGSWSQDLSQCNSSSGADDFDSILGADEPRCALPEASEGELMKALKYMIGGPARLRLTRVSAAPFRLSIDLDPRARRYLQGDRISTEADRARTAVALTVDRVASELTQQQFKSLASSRPGSEPSASRALFAIREEFLRVIEAEGPGGLARLHERGWAP